MSKKTLLIVVLSLLTACASLKGRYEIPGEHPEKLVARPMCSSCHTGELALFNHSGSFAQGGHAPLARQSSNVCSMCHAQSFCNDCHVTRSELKPSERRPTDVYRQMPHRGDYRSRHQIDGRLDPVSCFTCHGNPKAAKTCALCHGK